MKCNGLRIQIYEKIHGWTGLCIGCGCKSSYGEAFKLTTCPCALPGPIQSPKMISRLEKLKNRNFTFDTNNLTNYTCIINTINNIPIVILKSFEIQKIKINLVLYKQNILLSLPYELPFIVKDSNLPYKSNILEKNQKLYESSYILNVFMKFKEKYFRKNNVYIKTTELKL